VAFGLLHLIPQIAFPLVWVAPLLVSEPLLYRLQCASLLDHIEHGDWVLPASVTISTLICGFCWEMWNAYSLLRWVYTVPHLAFWKVFELPMLGYLGYPFFGLIAYRYATLLWFSATAGDRRAELISPVPELS
jgi:hypothetical protein